VNIWHGFAFDGVHRSGQGLRYLVPSPLNQSFDQLVYCNFLLTSRNFLLPSFPLFSTVISFLPSLLEYLISWACEYYR
jgi:hypothetical protein